MRLQGDRCRYGAVSDERIILNEDTLWAGHPTDGTVKDAYERYTVPLRKAVARGDHAMAEECGNHLQGPYTESYLPLGDLNLHFHHTDFADYRRELDIEKGVVCVSFTAGGVKYVRDTWVSTPDDVMVYRVTADKEGALSFDGELKSLLKNTVAFENGTLYMNGRAPSHAEPQYVDVPDEQAIVYGDKGLRFICAARIVTNGELQKYGDGFSVRHATEAVIFLWAGTDYNPQWALRDEPYNFPLADLKEKADKVLKRVGNKGYAQIYDAHILDMKSFFDRVELLPEYDGDLDSVPTAERLLRYQNGGEDIGLEKLYYLRRTDPTRLVHCEDACRLGKPENSDVYSRMYPSLADLDDFLRDETISTPIFLCEYSHAMGNGPGDVWMYWEKILKTPALIGGCIWEWADHTVEQNGVRFYGGDFKGELTHDGNFCCDGMVSADRKFKAGTMEIKAAYTPFRFALKNNTICLTNLFDFTDLSDYNIRYRVNCDGDILEENTVCIAIPPHKSAVILLEKPLPDCCLLGASVDVSLLKNGEERFSLTNEVKCRRTAEKTDSCTVIPQESAHEYIFRGEHFQYTFSKQLGNFTGICVDGDEKLKEPVTLTVFRAATDNERNIRHEWYQFDEWLGENLDKAFLKIYDTRLIGNTVKITGSIAGVSRRPALHFIYRVAVTENGGIRYWLEADIHTAVYLPRLGFEFVLREKNAPFRYFGYGKDECYADMMHHAKLGFFESRAADEYVPYVYPQEHGNHTGVRRIDIAGLRFKTDKTMDVNVSQFSARQLYEANHTDEIGKSDATYLRVDYKNSGIGSNSCGPRVADKYCLSEKKVKFCFNIEIE